MLGYSGEELSNLEQWDAISHPDERAPTRQRYLELLQGKSEKDEYEQHFVRRDGQHRRYQLKVQVAPGRRGKAATTLSTLTEDITERKRAEAELVTAKEAAEAATRAKSRTSSPT